jgi:hypothetical protein
MAFKRRSQLRDVRNRHAIRSARHPRGTVINASAGSLPTRRWSPSTATSTGLLKNVSRLTSSLNSQQVTASGRLALLKREHEIEPGRLLLAVVGDRHQQPAIEEEIASVALLPGEVQLGGEDRPVRRLHRHMEVSRASRI